MPHDIIDNRTRELAPEINNFLADSIRAHFAVGYFFFLGDGNYAELSCWFNELWDESVQVSKTQILLYNMVDYDKHESLAAHAEPDAEAGPPRPATDSGQGVSAKAHGSE